MPSWARLVATATIGRPLSAAACLAVSSVLPPPIPTTASKKPARSRARRSVAASTVPPSTIQISAFSSCGRRTSAISSPCPGPTAIATWPPLEIRRSASSGARPATAPGPMSMASGRADHPAQQRHATSRARVEVGVVVDLDPLEAADRRDADPPAAVGVLLEAVLVVELRVAPPGRLERVGQRRPPPRARSASARCTRPAAAAGSCALLMPRQQPVAGEQDLHLLLAERLGVVEREHELGVAAARPAAAPRPRAGAPCRRCTAARPRAKCSRAHHSE